MLVLVKFASLLLLLTPLAAIGLESQEPRSVREFPFRVLPIERVSASALGEDLLLVSPDDDSGSMVWWLPGEFWQLAFLEGGETPPEIRSFLASLDDYIVLGVLDATYSPLGRLEPKGEPATRRSLRLVDSTGWTYKPLSKDDVPGDMGLMFELMRPILVNNLGVTGSSLHFFLFDGKDRAGTRLVDAAKPGRFKVKTSTDVFEYTTPLPSLLEPKLCPEDGARMSGAWNYCPWHGHVLKLAPR